MRRSVLAVALALASAGCSDRAAVWDRRVLYDPAMSGAGSVALLDEGAERLVVVGVTGDLRTEKVSIPIGRSLATSTVTPDLAHYLVLTRGDVPRRTVNDEGAALYLVDATSTSGATTRYDLADPLSGLALDPASRFAVVHATSSDVAFVENPNELLVVDLSRAPDATNPAAITLRSFGGRPQRIDFTPPLALPNGSRRLLVVQTDRDLALIDLEAPTASDVTVRLTASTSAFAPAGIASWPGDDTSPPRLAIRIANDPSVVLLDLDPPTPDTPPGAAFRPVPNIVSVGDAASDVAFVKTDGGIRLAALVPSSKKLVLVEPATGVTTEVDLGQPFDELALVTDVVGATDQGSDVALVWSRSTPYVGFVALGATVGKPYKSLDVVRLDTPVDAVHDVPPPRQNLKVLEGADRQSFLVLDLVARTVSPLVASQGGVDVTLSPDGARAWALAPGSGNLASISLDDLHPRNLLLPRPIASVHDIARRDGGRALVAVHRVGAVGLTLLDAAAPSLVGSREVAGVFEEVTP